MSQTLVFIHVVAVAIFVGDGGLLLMLDPSWTVLAAGPDKGGVQLRITRINLWL